MFFLESLGSLEKGIIGSLGIHRDPYGSSISFLESLGIPRLPIVPVLGSLGIPREIWKMH